MTVVPSGVAQQGWLADQQRRNDANQCQGCHVNMVTMPKNVRKRHEYDDVGQRTNVAR